MKISRFALTFVSTATALLAAGTASAQSFRDEVGATESGALSVARLPAACRTYPLVVANDVTAKPRALAALGALSDTATLTWSDTRGTAESIDSINVELECEEGEFLGEALTRLVEGAPDLFQLDLEEWNLPEIECGSMDREINFYKSIRTRMGVYPMAQDTVTFIVKRIDDALVLNSVYAYYLPPASDAMTRALSACGQRSAQELKRVALRKRYEYQYYAPEPAPVCQIAGVGSYFVRAPDTLELTSMPSVEWTEGTHGIEIRKTLGATVRVAESHWTAKIINSDADCSFQIDGVNTYEIGFRSKLDAVTGTMLEVQAGANPFCTSCFMR